ncbi:MAG TPA: DUF29 domain-containing protein [Lamprocystis sp. (in: g-proteobacteria)]|nr:DUF29 domain-containing protein [Lamprocystis sp. (in: g-proteobacteria)]
MRSPTVCGPERASIRKRKNYASHVRRGLAGLYERDFHAWANEQAGLLRAGKLASVDLAHVAEEIESMGRSERRELVNRLVVLVMHLLKWRYRPGRQGTSWRLSIKEQRIRLKSHLEDNPSLKSQIDWAITQAYPLALIEAERETGLHESTFPSICPFPYGQLLDDAFWPDAAGSH